eukprot:8545477-Pyramimonas_sp.AAC.1
MESNTFTAPPRECFPSARVCRAFLIQACSRRYSSTRMAQAAARMVIFLGPRPGPSSCWATRMTTSSCSSARWGMRCRRWGASLASRQEPQRYVR